jgi:hypothetical protein
VHEVLLGSHDRRVLSTTSPQVEPGEPLLAEVRHFVECVLRRRLPLASAAGATGVVRTLCAMERSLGAGGREEPVG